MIRVCIVGSDDENMYEVARYVRYALDRITPGIYNDIPIDGTEFLNATFDPEGSYELENQSWVLEFKFRVIDDYIRDSTTAPSINMPIVTSGTYTPTIAELSNTTVLSVQQAQYMRVGNTVTVSGTFGLMLTDASTSGVFTLTLPIPSAAVNDEDIAGVASAVVGAAFYTGQIDAYTTTDKARATCVGNDSSPVLYSYQFTYQII